MDVYATMRDPKISIYIEEDGRLELRFEEGGDFLSLSLGYIAGSDREKEDNKRIKEVLAHRIQHPEALT